jgi:hypothetical protein
MDALSSSSAFPALVTAFSSFSKSMPMPQDEKIQRAVSEIMARNKDEIAKGQESFKNIESYVSRLKRGGGLSESEAKELNESFSKLRDILMRAGRQAVSLPQDVKETFSKCRDQYEEFLNVFVGHLPTSQRYDAETVRSQLSLRVISDIEVISTAIESIKRNFKSYGSQIEDRMKSLKEEISTKSAEYSHVLNKFHAIRDSLLKAYGQSDRGKRLEQGQAYELLNLMKKYQDFFDWAQTQTFIEESRVQTFRGDTERDFGQFSIRDVIQDFEKECEGLPQERIRSGDADLDKAFERLDGERQDVLRQLARFPDEEGLVQRLESYEAKASEFVKDAEKKIREKAYRMKLPEIAARLSLPPGTIMRAKLGMLKTDLKTGKQFSTLQPRLSAIFEELAGEKKLTDDAKAKFSEVKHFMQDIARDLSEEEYGRLLSMAEEFNIRLRDCVLRSVESDMEKKREPSTERVAAIKPTREIWRAEAVEHAAGGRVVEEAGRSSTPIDVEAEKEGLAKQYLSSAKNLFLELPQSQQGLGVKEAKKADLAKESEQSSHSLFAGFIETLAIFFPKSLPSREGFKKPEELPRGKEALPGVAHRVTLSEQKAISEDLKSLVKKFELLIPAEGKRIDESLIIQGEETLKWLEEPAHAGANVIRRFSLLREALERASLFVKSKRPDEISIEDKEKVLSSIKRYNSLVRKWSAVQKEEDRKPFEDTMLLPEELEKTEEHAESVEEVKEGAIAEQPRPEKISYAGRIARGLRRVLKMIEAKTNFVKYMVTYRLGCMMREAAEEKPRDRAELEKLFTIDGILRERAPKGKKPDEFLQGLIAEADKVEHDKIFASNENRRLKLELEKRLEGVDRKISDALAEQKRANKKEKPLLDKKIQQLRSEVAKLTAASKRVSDADAALSAQAERFETIASFFSLVKPKPGSKLGEVFEFTKTPEEYEKLKKQIVEAQKVVQQIRASFKA